MSKLPPLATPGDPERGGSTEITPAARIRSMPGARIDSLLKYVHAEGRVCPMPSAWVKLREMLGPESPEIAILAGWWAVPQGFKALMLDAQIRYAGEHGKLARVDRFLRSLGPKEWLRAKERDGEADQPSRAQPCGQLPFDF